MKVVKSQDVIAMAKLFDSGKLEPKNASGWESVVECYEFEVPDQTESEPEMVLPTWYEIDGDTRGYRGDVVLKHKNGDFRIAHSNWISSNMVLPYGKEKETESYKETKFEMGYLFWTPLGKENV